MQELVTKIEEVMAGSPPLHPSTAAVDLMLAVGRLQVRGRHPSCSNLSTHNCNPLCKYLTAQFGNQSVCCWYVRSCVRFYHLLQCLQILFFNFIT